MMKSVWESRKKIIGLVAVLLLVLLMMNINSRLSEYFRLSNERDRLGTEVAYSRATKVALDTQVAYATSDRAVEDWARDEAHMARPGDKVIVPVTPANETPQPVIQVTPTPTTVENWQVWWALFFGE
jgi:cell division protein FtsB